MFNQNSFLSAFTVLFGFLLLSCSSDTSNTISNPTPTPTPAKTLVINFVSTINDTATNAHWVVQTTFSTGDDIADQMCNQNPPQFLNGTYSAFHLIVDFSKECGFGPTPPSGVNYSVEKTGYKSVSGSLAVSPNDQMKTIIVKLTQ